MRTPEVIKRQLYDMYNNVGIVRTIEEASRLYPESITKPIKPRLDNPHTSQQALAYSAALQEYENDIEVYNANDKLRNQEIRVINEQLVAFIKDVSGLYGIPKQYQDKVYSYAYNRSHSDGMYEIFLTLCELVNIFD
jgi:hypothetical protein